MHELYGKIDTILHKMQCVNEQAMIICQSLGYNGFKRMHRCDAKEIYCERMELACELFDKYQEKMVMSSYSHMYSPINLKDHIMKWDHELEYAISELGMLNKMHFEKAGVEHCVITDAICLVMKRHEKTKRWWKRFEEGGWSAHDMHMVDDCLHKKFKKAEEK